MKVIAIIQARMGSTRLPGKVLMELAGEPMLVRCVNRTRRTPVIDEVVVATTVQPADDAIEHLCDSKGWSYFRGSENDVLDRYYRAALAHQADVVVRITSDCPLIEPEVVDRVVQEFIERQPQVDYAVNEWFPRGLDTEVMRFDILKQAWGEDHNPVWREHVTPYIYHKPNLFQLHYVMNEVNLSHMRWTVDTPQDWALVRRIYEHFGHDRFSWRQVLSLLAENPSWLELNQQVKQKVVL